MPGFLRLRSATSNDCISYFSSGCQSCQSLHRCVSKDLWTHSKQSRPTGSHWHWGKHHSSPAQVESHQEVQTFRRVSGHLSYTYHNARVTRLTNNRSYETTSDWYIGCIANNSRGNSSRSTMIITWRRINYHQSQTEEEVITSNYTDNGFNQFKNDEIIRTKRNTYSQPCTCRNHYQ